MVNKNTIIIVILIIFVIIIIYYYESKKDKDRTRLLTSEYYQDKQPELKCPPCPACPKFKDLVNEQSSPKHKNDNVHENVVKPIQYKKNNDLDADYERNMSIIQPKISQNANIATNEDNEPDPRSISHCYVMPDENMPVQFGDIPLPVGNMPTPPGNMPIPVRDVPVPIGNMVRDYDYNNIYDELKRPTYRPSMNILGPGFIPSLPVRGPRDAPTWVGIIVFDDTKPTQKITDKNKILRVYGREKYYHSNDYEYYAVIDSGSGKTKTSIVREDGRRNELYDGDKVKVPIFDDAIYKFTRNEHQIFDTD